MKEEKLKLQQTKNTHRIQLFYFRHIHECCKFKSFLWLVINHIQNIYTEGNLDLDDKIIINYLSIVDSLLPIL